MTTDLQVPVVAPVLPLVLANTAFLSTLATVEKQVAELKITDAASAQLAANLQVRLTGAGKQLEATRVELKRPFLEIERKIDDAAREPQKRIEIAKKTLQQAQIQFDMDQRRIAAEAEQKRQTEIRRLEELRKAEELAAKKKAEAIAAEQRKLAEEAKAAALKASAPPPGAELDVDFGDDTPPEPAPKTEVELALERAKFTPAPVAQKPAGISFRVRLRAVVVDINKLPDVFVTRTAKDQAIYATFCAKFREGDPMPELAGVHFEIERTAVSTGKETF